MQMAAGDYIRLCEVVPERHHVEIGYDPRGDAFELRVVGGDIVKARQAFKRLSNIDDAAHVCLLQLSRPV